MTIVPPTLANRVSSPPIPTFFPGLNRVPRCRTMMLPPLTTWPANAFIPKRRPALSRPFLELPTPFLCAMLASVRIPGRNTPLGDDLGDPDLRQLLAVTRLAAVLLPLLELEHVDLLSPGLGHDLRNHPRPREGRLADLHRAAVGDQEHAIQLHLACDRSRDQLQ